MSDPLERSVNDLVDAAIRHGVSPEDAIERIRVEWDAQLYDLRVRVNRKLSDAVAAAKK